MMRLIDADAFFNDFSEIRDYEWASQEYEVDAEPVRHGRWIFNPKDAIEMMFTLPKCSECGAESPIGGNYCPYCGAKMDGSIDWIGGVDDAEVMEGQEVESNAE